MNGYEVANAKQQYGGQGQVALNARLGSSYKEECATDQGPRSSEAALAVMAKQFEFLDGLVSRAHAIADRLAGPVPAANGSTEKERTLPGDLQSRLNLAGDVMSKLSGRLEHAVQRLESFV